VRGVELGPESGVYFPAKTPHSIEVLGFEPLRYVYTYACEKLGQTVDMKVVEGKATGVDLPNVGSTRWALREEIEPWMAVESSKGMKIRAHRLFDSQRGSSHEMIAGIGVIDPGIHYSLHYHDQPEIYYIVSGRAILYVKDSAIEVFPGSTIYIGGRVVHGVDCIGEEPLRIYYIYGTEIVGQKVNWTPVEDIYTEVRWKK
jgi:mannose-6-phosphate isomerase-like protein (cupin superfamily)